ncbi:hypothetical protein NLM33_46685 [Bradyrhizobium sp. CCGUVB1N3]|uniref:hypothetical protein n=1 Tax=Bradyrhizobium sp. CCGUVB1N3 TaxID=2949629 RepID=UPI0020B2B146|nr:hypothetical protein [Bradyrhizobium sp. CCGUVB1N3]MCP3477646.1 hypothetical protein [Bradyrhizobium sp. CCGUVB1N3]
MNLLQRAFQATVNGLCSALSADRADETLVCLHDMYEQHRSTGRSVTRALSSCAVQFTSALAADWWLRFASPQHLALANGGVIMSKKERFAIYRGQATVGALIAVCLLWAIDHHYLFQYHQEVFATTPGARLSLLIFAAFTFLMVCRTAYRRHELLPLAMLYAAGKGAVVGFYIFAIGMALLDLAYLNLWFLTRLLLPLFVAGGAILNVYAKYLSPDCARAQ